MYFWQGELEGAWMSFAKIHLPGSVCRFWVDNADTGLAHLIGAKMRVVSWSASVVDQNMAAGNRGARVAPDVKGIGTVWRRC